MSERNLVGRGDIQREDSEVKRVGSSAGLEDVSSRVGIGVEVELKKRKEEGQTRG